MILQKKCPNCNKLFGPTKFANGKTEYPSLFKKKTYCSKICGAIGNAAAKKVARDKERRAYE